MEIVGIAGLVVSAGAFLWGVGVWITNRFRDIYEKLSKHDTADSKMKSNVKSVKLELASLRTDVSRIEDKVDWLLDKAA